MPQITALVTGFGAGSTADGSVKPVIFAGHSLGGALANIAAARQQLASPGSVAAVHTFGAPRVGDATWAAAYNDLGLSSITSRQGGGLQVLPLRAAHR